MKSHIFDFLNCEVGIGRNTDMILADVHNYHNRPWYEALEHFVNLLVGGS
jgi:hypothetical protein